jgi:SAM-dependent methyltransferase
MNFDDSTQRRVFFEVHSGLPREGPGNRESTERALALAGDLPAQPRVLDIACGPGMQTIDLADLLPNAKITAIAGHAPFLIELRRRAAQHGYTPRITTQLADLRALPFAPSSFDLIWREGAAYIMGFEQALEAWRPLLTRSGRLAVTEPVWLRADAPDHVVQPWVSYPAMTDVAGCRAAVARAGLTLLGDFVLPEAAWWDHYYGPMQSRLAELEQAYPNDATARAVLDACAREIELYRDYASFYGYVFLIMSRQLPKRVAEFAP